MCVHTEAQDSSIHIYIFAIFEGDPGRLFKKELFLICMSYMFQILSL